MGSGTRKAGAVLLIAGCLLAVLFFVIGMFFMLMERENKVLDEDDFSNVGYDDYKAYLSDDDAGSSIRIVIKSRIPGESVRFYLTVEDDWGYEIYDPYGVQTTPYDNEISLDTYMVGQWEILIEFVNDYHEDYDISDVDITVYSTSLSDGDFAICCGLLIMPVIGLIMAVVGLIFVITGGKKEQKKPQYSIGQRPIRPGAPPVQPRSGSQYPAGGQGPQRPPPVQNRGFPPGSPPQSQKAGRPIGPRESQNIAALKTARDHEKAGNFSQAIQIYEGLELFDDAERCIRRSKGLPPKDTDPVHVLKMIRLRGSPAEYNCYSCRRDNIIDGTKLGKRFCDHCGTPIDFDILAQK